MGGIRVSVLDLELLTASLSRGRAHQESRATVAAGGGAGVWAGCVLTSGSALQMRRALFLGASALLLPWLQCLPCGPGALDSLSCPALW